MDGVILTQGRQPLLAPLQDTAVSGGVGVWRASEGPVPWLREEVLGHFFIRNSFEMEARGRSEAFRVRLGQAIAQELRASPSFPSSGTIQ